MKLKESHWLNAIGVSLWRARSPERFKITDQLPDPIAIPPEIQLLFVTDSPLDQPQIDFLSKVLQAMDLTLSDVAQLPSEAIPFIKEHSLKWCWFCDVPSETLVPRSPLSTLFTEKEPPTEMITSPSLKLIQKNPLEKRNLWRQIAAIPQQPQPRDKAD